MQLPYEHVPHKVWSLNFVSGSTLEVTDVLEGMIVNFNALIQ